MTIVPHNRQNKIYFQLGVVIYACNHSTWKTKARQSQVPDEFGLDNETQSQRTRNYLKHYHGKKKKITLVRRKKKKLFTNKMWHTHKELKRPLEENFLESSNRAWWYIPGPPDIPETKLGKQFEPRSLGPTWQYNKTTIPFKRQRDQEYSSVVKLLLNTCLAF